MNEEVFMRMAIQKAREGIEAGQTPFGAVIVWGGEVVAAAHNTVWRDTDPTAHAEINAIRQASSVLRRINLSGCTMFSTCEPCPMCLSAIHWAKIQRVVFGASIEDAAAAGFSELHVSAERLVRLGGGVVRVEPGPLQEECRALFEEWKRRGLSRAY